MGRFSCTNSVPGSPPRGRGKGKARNAVTHQLRITPAWAGKSICLALPITAPRDHPRVGGEKGQAYPCTRKPQGSPPRGRGKGRCHHLVILVNGITPAWAGKSPLRPRRARPPPDHPRMGGENLNVAMDANPILGSPPRGRGKGLGLAVNVLGDGIIPAWAGKSYCPATRSFGSWDHPRVGGEKGFRQ